MARGKEKRAISTFHPAFDSNYIYDGKTCTA